jgi:hypothetical protein
MSRKRQGRLVGGGQGDGDQPHPHHPGHEKEGQMPRLGAQELLLKMEDDIVGVVFVDGEGFPGKSAFDRSKRLSDLANKRVGPLRDAERYG